MVPGNVALGGCCPVCLVEMGKQVQGSTEFKSTFDGQVHLFPSAKRKSMFDNNIDRYDGAGIGLAGHYPVCEKETGREVPGKPEYFRVYKGRLFLSPGQKQLDMFKGNPDKYANADLALAGYCPICLERMNKLVLGMQDFTATYNGRRYLFPSEEQLRMFTADPAYFSRAEVVKKYDRLQREQVVNEIRNPGASSDCGCDGH
jgi:YHS domain-containing protein